MNELKISLDQLKKMMAAYRLKVLRVQPLEDGYLVETNKGKKRVTVWKQSAQLKWSNAWREQMTTLGHQAVEKFIPNMNKKKYIRYQGKYFVLSHVPEGRKPDVSNDWDLETAGRVYAQYHHAVEQVEPKTTLVNHTPFSDDFFIQGSKWIKEGIQEIEQKEHPTLIDELIYSNLPLLYQRFRRAYQLWEGVKDTIFSLPLSYASFQLDQLTETEHGWHLSGGYNQPLVTLHHDTVHLLRELYEKSNWREEAVFSFLKGYEVERTLSDTELIYILFQLAVPVEVWTYFNQYMQNGEITPEEADKLVDAIRKQKYWDHLAAKFGRYIDERNRLKNQTIPFQ